MLVLEYGSFGLLSTLYMKDLLQHVIVAIALVKEMVGSNISKGF